MKPFITINNSRKKIAHILYLNAETNELESLCKTTDAHGGPRSKSKAHEVHLHETLPKDYNLCGSCLLRAYASSLIDLEFKFKRSLVEIGRNNFQERPLTLGEYKSVLGIRSPTKAFTRIGRSRKLMNNKITIFGMASGEKIYTTDYTPDEGGDYAIHNKVEVQSISYHMDSESVTQSNIRLVGENLRLILRGNLIESIEVIYEGEIQ